jgi:carbamoylphosphate synthase small subunit
VRVSNFRATRTLSDYLQREGTVAIADIDTRRLTRILRSQRRAERLHRQPSRSAPRSTRR